MMFLSVRLGRVGHGGSGTDKSSRTRHRWRSAISLIGTSRARVREKRMQRRCERGVARAGAGTAHPRVPSPWRGWWLMRTAASTSTINTSAYIRCSYTVVRETMSRPIIVAVPSASAITALTQPTKPTVIDIHTHIYPPSYISLLSSRKTVPYIHQDSDGSADPRLIILPSDDDQSKPLSERGRPIDKTYSSWGEKLGFMATHEIDVSVVSLANPWLDWLDPSTAAETARSINDDMNEACQSQNSKGSEQRLYAMASLPLSAPVEQVVKEIERVSELSCIKGIILGTTGLGSGLDDPELEPIYTALASTKTLVFLHPHYGLPAEAFGGQETIAKSGHVLPLALGFPLETTIAVTRMYLAGVFDRHKNLQMLLAHSGGTLPFLAGRIQSCVEHEREFTLNGGQKQGPQRDIWDVLRHNIYLDAVIYGKAGLEAAIEAGGVDRLMFGTDHPFFPPIGKKKDGGEKWVSVVSNRMVVDASCGTDTKKARMILGGNAAKVLGIDV